MEVVQDKTHCVCLFKIKKLFTFKPERCQEPSHAHNYLPLNYIFLQRLKLRIFAFLSSYKY